MGPPMRLGIWKQRQPGPHFLSAILSRASRVGRREIYLSIYLSISSLYISLSPHVPGLWSSVDRQSKVSVLLRTGKWAETQDWDPQTADKCSAGQQAPPQTPVGERGDDPAETDSIRHTHHLQIHCLPRKEGVREEISTGWRPSRVVSLSWINWK